MRIHDLDITLLEKNAKKMRKDLQDGTIQNETSWLLFVLDLENTIRLLKEKIDPYGEKDIE